MLEKKTELHDIYKENENLKKIQFKENNEMPASLPNTSVGEDFEINKKPKKLGFKFSTGNIIDITETFDVLNKEMQSNDFFTRLIAINLSIEEDKNYDFDVNFSKKMKSFLPWEDEFYSGKSQFQIYTSKNFPEWLKIANKSK